MRKLIFTAIAGFLWKKYMAKKSSVSTRMPSAPRF
jgi:hypothetical protein